MEGRKKSNLGVLMRVQFLSFADKLTNFGTRSKGMVAFIVIAILYCFGIFFFMALKTFGSMAVLCQYGMGWLYFGFCGLSSLAACLFTSVMMAENLIFSPKDNGLLFAMPIKPKSILLARLWVLVLFDFIFTVLIFGIAVFSAGKYMSIGFPQMLGMFVAVVGITLVAQAVVCVFAWLLHLMLSKIPPAFAALLFMVIFLGLYFLFMAKGGEALTKLIEDPKFAGDLLIKSGVGELMKSAGWPLYAMGMSVMGNYVYMALFGALALAITVITWLILSRTFIKTALIEGRSGSVAKRKKVGRDDFKVAGVHTSVAKKELAHFTASPVYLTNSGVGIIMMIMGAVASVFAKDKVLEAFAESGFSTTNLSMLLFLFYGFLIATTPLTAPNISLEGKELWILRGLPISAKDVLLGKLKFNLMLVMPVVLVCVPATMLVMKCDLAETAVMTLASLALAYVCAVTGLVINLAFPRFDWEKEVTPCKQSMSVPVSMFAGYGVLLLTFGVFMATKRLPFLASGALVLAVLVVMSALLHSYLVTKGAKKWDSFDC